MREFYPSPDNPRYTPERGGAAVREYLRLRCPDLNKPPARDSGTIVGRVRMDTTGKATVAQLNGTSGDPLMDGVIGTVLAQLDMSADSTHKREYQARVAYACRDSVGARIDLTP